MDGMPAPVDSRKNKVNYGIDAPGVIYSFWGAAIGLGLVGWGLPLFSPLHEYAFVIRLMFSSAAVVCSVFGLAMLAYGLRGKFNHRDQMLSMITWRGDEQVLDIGTGRGLLLISAAKKLTTGKSIGIDIWQEADLSGNTVENTRRNIEREGVQANTELKFEDARQLSFADESFDVILSLLCLHNIDGASGRLSACQELARVLKPGATAIISDYVGTSEYAQALAQAGLQVEKPKSYIRQSYGLMFMVVARKGI